MPIEMRVSHYNDIGVDQTKPCYEVSYATEKHGTTHYHRVFEKKKKRSFVRSESIESVEK